MKPDAFVFYPRLLSIAAIVLPCLLIVFTLVLLTLSRGDLMFYTGLLAAALASTLLITLGAAVPEAFAAMWTRQLLISRKTSQPASKVEYEAFLKSFRGWADGPGGWVVAALFAVFAVPQFFPPGTIDNVGSRGLEGLLIPLRAMAVEEVIGIAVTAAVGFVLGFFAWRMTIVGAYVYRLGVSFNCRVQSQHPDGAGGLASLGTICLINALILIVPSAFLGLWRTVIAKDLGGYREPYLVYENWFAVLLAVTVVLTLAAFIVPLYGVRRAMLLEKAARQEELDRISDAIEVLTRAMRAAAGKGDTVEVEKLKAQRAILADLYANERDIPTWPVNTAIVRSYIVSQLVPLLSVTKLTDALAQRFLKP